MDSIESLLKKRNELPYESSERVTVTEDIIRLYDAQKDIRAAFSERSRLIGMANDAGFPDKMLVAFSWCVAQHDKDPQIAGHWSPLDNYKIILEYVPVFPTISREQIRQVQDDMEKRLVEAGQSVRTAHYFRSWNLMRMGDYDEALKYHEMYTGMRRNYYSDCEACERDRQVELMSRMHRHNDCMKLAKPILSGKMGCAEVPEFTYGHVVRSYLNAGEVDAAGKLYAKASRAVKGDNNYLGTMGDLLVLLARTDKWNLGTDLIEGNLPLAVETSAVELQMRFYSGVACFAGAVAERGGRGKWEISLPRSFPLRNSEGVYDPAELATWFGNESTRLAEQFDQRNGNSAYTALLAENRRLSGLS
ncbi:MAG: hypothetical protein P1V20_06540 [Verrucomicrobiales bacterium]|nr:hypothetical protein [Verrucomicrobiales bacterium]